MYLSKSTWVVLLFVLMVMVLSVTVFKDTPGSAQSTQTPKRSVKSLTHAEMIRRYPVASFEEAEPADAVKRADLRERKRRNNAIPFAEPSQKDEATAFLPERLFDFPALPVSEADAIVVGQVLSSTAHRSENQHAIFSEFEVRIDEVLKGPAATLKGTQPVTVERTGGFLQYPGGRKVLFFIPGYGMPEVATRDVFFLKRVDHGWQILTLYELTSEGVLPLDQSNQFERFRGESEDKFLKTLRDAIVQ